MKTALTGIPVLPLGIIAELYTITLVDGTTLYYTTADTDLTYRGDLYLSRGIAIERDTIRSSVGVEVDDVMITLYPMPTTLIQGVTLPIFVNNGGFDGAFIKIERARQAYTVHLFEGMVTDAQADRTKVNLTVSASTVLLNIQMPRNLYNPSCIHTLFDGGCGLAKSAFDFPSTAASGSLKNKILCGLTQDNGYFDLGTLLFTSGENTGISSTIKVYETGVFTLAYPLLRVPAIGDTFIAYPGCDGTQASCKDKFNNFLKYRGFPFMPVPEASI